MFESGGCLSHLSDLLLATACGLTALADIANLIADLAHGGVDLGLLGSVLFFSDLTLLVLLPVLLPGLDGLLLGLGSQDGLALAASLKVGLRLFFGHVGVPGDVFCGVLLSLLDVSLHLKLPVLLPPDTILFFDLDLFLLPLLTLESFLSDPFFFDPQLFSIGRLL